MDADIIIIGAGAAGLSAGFELAGKKNILILEARNRIGGRIYTFGDEGFSQPVELGAEFIHGRLPVTFDLLEKTGLHVSPSGGVPVRLENGKLQRSTFHFDHWDEFAKQLQMLEQDLSVAEFLSIYFSDEKYTGLRNSIRGFAEGYDAADTELASTFSLRDEWLNERDETQYRIEGGYGKLMQYLADEIVKKGGVIYLNSVIGKIEWSKNQVKVFTTENKLFTAKQLILTVPIGVLQSGEIEFSPEIPEYFEAIGQLGYGHVIKLLIEFKNQFRENILKDHALQKMGFLFTGKAIPTWWTQYPSDYPLLSGWLAGPPARNKKEMTDDTLRDLAIQTLSETFQISTQEMRMMIRTMKIANWSSDPFSRGAYSYATVHTTQARNILSEPLEDTIWFAGEAFYPGPEMGTVEAALANGSDVAKNIL